MRFPERYAAAETKTWERTFMMEWQSKQFLREITQGRPFKKKKTQDLLLEQKTVTFQKEWQKVSVEQKCQQDQKNLQF